MGYIATSLEHYEIAVERRRPTAHNARREAATCCCVSAWAEMLNRMRDLDFWFIRGHHIYDVI